MKNLFKFLLITTFLTFNFSCSTKNLQQNLVSPNSSLSTQSSNLEKRELQKENRKAEKLTKEKEKFSISPPILAENEKLYISLKSGWKKEKDASKELEYRVLFRNDEDQNKQKNLLIISNNFSSSVTNEELAIITERLAVEYFTIDKITDFRKGKINNIEFYSAGGVNTKENSLYGLLFLRKNEQAYLVFCEDKNDLKDCAEILSTIE